MSVIRTNPESIESYGRTASQQFDHMRSELEALRPVVTSRFASLQEALQAQAETNLNQAIDQQVNEVLAAGR